MHNEYDKNKRIYPIPCIALPKSTPIALPPADTGTIGGKGPVKDGWESLDGEDAGPVQAINSMENEGPVHQLKLQLVKAGTRKVPRWPDSGIAMPSPSEPIDFSLGATKIVFPREDDKSPQTAKKIHSFGLTEDFEGPSDDDDQNDFGGLGSIENEDTKYGPGNYPDDNRSTKYYHNLIANARPQFVWLIPGVLAVGPHPILTSHQSDLSVLKDAGFKSIITVFDKPLDKKYRKGFHYIFVPATEGASGELPLICSFIDIQEDLGNPVFIHSLNGEGRAATAAAAYIVHKGWLNAEQAIAWVRQNYNQSAMTTDQEDAVIELDSSGKC